MGSSLALTLPVEPVRSGLNSLETLLAAASRHASGCPCKKKMHIHIHRHIHICIYTYIYIDIYIYNYVCVGRMMNPDFGASSEAKKEKTFGS